MAFLNDSGHSGSYSLSGLEAATGMRMMPEGRVGGQTGSVLEKLSVCEALRQKEFDNFKEERHLTYRHKNEMY